MMLSNELERIAEEIKKPDWIKVVKKIEAARKSFNSMNDEALMLSLFRDIVSSLRRNAPVERYLKEIKEYQKDGKFPD